MKNNEAILKTLKQIEKQEVLRNIILFGMNSDKMPDKLFDLILEDSKLDISVEDFYKRNLRV